MGQGCVGLCCVAVDGDLPHAQHLPEHALFRRRVAAFVWRHGWRDTAGVCRVLCCDENGGDRQASVLPCHRQNVCRGVPQLQLGIYLPQAARTHRDENIKRQAGGSSSGLPLAPSRFRAAQRYALGHDGDVAQHDREIVRRQPPDEHGGRQIVAEQRRKRRGRTCPRSRRTRPAWESSSPRCTAAPACP